MGGLLAHTYKCGLNTHSLSNAMLALPEARLAPNGEGQLLLDRQTDRQRAFPSFYVRPSCDNVR